MKDISTIIKGLQVTEKGTALTERENKYLFRVDRTANKTEIKRAVEALFKVSVASVNTMRYRGKKKREQEELERKRAIQLENAYLVRDLVSSRDGKKLWSVIGNLLAAREVLALSDMQNAKKRTPVYDTSNNIVGYRDEEFTLEDFYSHRGLIEGLRWLPQEIEDLRGLAEREDKRRSEEED